MKKYFASTPLLLFLMLCLSGCNTVGAKSTSLTIIYGAAAVLSLLLLIGCCRLVRKQKAWLVMLFSSVLVVNIGYTFLAMSTSLTMALWANRVAYLGSVFLPLSMLMILLNVTGESNQITTLSPMLAKVIAMEFGYDAEWILHGDKQV